MDPDEIEKHRERVALFRYGLIADLLHHPAGARGLYKLLHEKAARDHDIPGTLRRKVAAETIRDWLQSYRGGGFDALKPKGDRSATPGCFARESVLGRSGARITRASS